MFFMHISSLPKISHITRRYRVVKSLTMEPNKYPPSLTSQSTSFVPSDEQSDCRIILDDKNLPPVDGGAQAWLFLIASSMLEALVWGA